MTTIVSGSSITFNDNTTQNTSAYGGGFAFRNRIINGDMRIDQRNAGASVTITALFAHYITDRFIVRGTQASKLTAQQNAGSVTPPTGYNYYLGTTSSSAYTVTSSDYFVIEQRIEGYNVADLAWGTANAKTVTLSFWVRSSLTGTFGGSLTNGALDRSYPFSYTISSANTWEQKTITIAGDTTGTWLTTNGIGMSLFLSLGSGTSLSGTAGAWAGAAYTSATGATSVVGTNGATFYITGVQLEKGSTATSFDYRPYGQELALCQRYYYVHASGNAKVYATAAYYSSAYITSYAQFAVRMRAAPSLVVATGTDYYIFYRNSSTDTFNTLGLGGVSEQGAELYNNSEASGTAGQAGFVQTNNASASIAFNAEL